MEAMACFFSGGRTPVARNTTSAGLSATSGAGCPPSRWTGLTHSAAQDASKRLSTTTLPYSTLLHTRPGSGEHLRSTTFEYLSQRATNPELFDAIAALGADCRGAWTASKQSKSGVSWIGTGSLPLGKATWDGDSISFANGRSIEGVHQNVWDFEVSGYRVLQKWFAAREQWIITVANSLQALGTVIAVSELVDLGPALNDALKQLVGP